MIRVVVADDQALVRGGFRVLVDSAPDLEVVGEAGDGAEAVALARTTQPDVVLMDIRMPHLDGLEATRLICQSGETGSVRVLILTTFDLDEYVYAALRAGASGFLLKDTPPADLLAGIRVVAAGDALLAPSVTRQLISEFVRRPDSDRPPPAQPRRPHRAASARYWRWWPGAGPTRRSPSGCTSARRPRRPTSAGC